MKPTGVNFIADWYVQYLLLRTTDYGLRTTYYVLPVRYLRYVVVCSPQ